MESDAVFAIIAENPVMHQRLVECFVKMRLNEMDLFSSEAGYALFDESKKAAALERHGRVRMLDDIIFSMDRAYRSVGKNGSGAVSNV